MPSTPSRNLEIKVLCPNLEEVRQRIPLLETSIRECLRQVDTYFHATQGRLKLRMIAEMTESGTIGPITRAELIGYHRANLDGPRWSSYLLTPIAAESADILRATLAATLGVRVTVAKRREIAIARATRIHLDTVDGLGTFVELETVIGEQSEEDASLEHAHIITTLGLDRLSPISGSYSDLLRSAQTA